MNLEKFKVEWKQQCDLWGPMSHRRLLQSNASMLSRPTRRRPDGDPALEQVAHLHCKMER